MNHFDPIPAMDAYKRSMANEFCKYPAKGDARIQELAAPTFAATFKLVPGESIFTIGSCFARGIEWQLATKNYEVPCYRYTLPEHEVLSGIKMLRGVLNKYSPMSMLNEVVGAFEAVPAETFLVETTEKGKFMDMQLHNNVPTLRERGIERRTEMAAMYRDAISKSRVAIVTLGLIETWIDYETGFHMNQAPSFNLVKANPKRFGFEVLSPQKTIYACETLIAKLKAYGHPEQKMVLTVSPVPFGRTFTSSDAIVANSYSKSVLRVAAEVVAGNNPHVDYFPSFETVMHSERGPTWRDDQIHVTEPMLKHNVGRMLAAYAL